MEKLGHCLDGMYSHILLRYESGGLVVKHLTLISRVWGFDFLELHVLSVLWGFLRILWFPPLVQRHML